MAGLTAACLRAPARLPWPVRRGAEGAASGVSLDGADVSTGTAGGYVAYSNYRVTAARGSVGAPFASTQDARGPRQGVTGMRPRRLIFLSSLMLAVAALSPAAAQGATNGTARPLKGRSTATVIVNPPAGTGTVDGTVLFTLLGKAPYHTDLTGFTVTGNTFAFTGTATFVAANGDKVFTTIVGTGTVTTTGSESTTVDTIT